MDKRGVSPVIATIILVGIVVALGLVIFAWFRGFVKEEGTKFGKNVQLVCEDVRFGASYNDADGVLSIVNNGNVPIYSLKVKLEGTGSYETKDITDLAPAWPDTGLLQGGSFNTGDIRSQISGKDKMIVTPVLAGTSGSGERIYVCEEQYGYEIDL